MLAWEKGLKTTRQLRLPEPEPDQPRRAQSRPLKSAKTPAGGQPLPVGGA
jgi:hypothetical protein